MEQFIYQIFVFLLYIYSAMPVYTYLISSKSFRRDFKRLMKDIYRILSGQNTAQVATRERKSVMQ